MARQPSMLALKPWNIWALCRKEQDWMGLDQPEATDQQFNWRTITDIGRFWRVGSICREPQIHFEKLNILFIVMADKFQQLVDDE